MKHVLWLLIGCIGLAGCARTQKVADATTDPAGEQQSPEQVRSEFEQRAEQLSAIARQLPGRDAEQHRSLMIDTLAQLEAVLPLLQASDGNGAFQQRLSIISSARQRLSDAPDVRPEPMLNSALSAAQSALAAIAAERGNSNAEIAAAVDSAGRRVDELDEVRGALHRLVVAQAVRDMARAIELMK